MKSTNIPPGLSVFTDIAGGSVKVEFTQPPPAGKNEYLQLAIVGYVQTAQGNTYEATMDLIAFQGAGSKTPGYVAWTKNSGAQYPVVAEGAGTQPSVWIAIPFDTNWPNILWAGWDKNKYPKQMLILLNAAPNILKPGTLVTPYLNFIVSSYQGVSCQGLNVYNTTGLTLGKFDNTYGYLTFQAVPPQWITGNGCTFQPSSIKKLLSVLPGSQGLIRLAPIALDQFGWGPTMIQQMTLVWYIDEFQMLSVTAKTGALASVPRGTNLLFAWDPSGKLLVTNSAGITPLVATFDFSRYFGIAGITPANGVMILSFDPTPALGLSLLPLDMSPPPPFDIGGGGGMCTTSDNNVWYTPGAKPGVKVALTQPVSAGLSAVESWGSVNVKFVPYNDPDGDLQSVKITVPGTENFMVAANLGFIAYVDPAMASFVVVTPDGKAYSAPFNQVMKDRYGYGGQWGFYVVAPSSTYAQFPCMSSVSSIAAPPVAPPYVPTPTPGPTPGPSPDNTGVALAVGAGAIGLLVYFMRS